MRNTISLTVLASGSKTNVIPPEASAELDVRLLPDQDPKAFLAELTQVIADDQIRIETLLSFPPASSPSDHELFDVLREIAARRHPGAVVASPLATGFTDCHYFRERGIPCYGFLPFELSDRDARARARQRRADLDREPEVGHAPALRARVASRRRAAPRALGEWARPTPVSC